MAYDSALKKITAPVSVYDVQRCLATSKNGLKDLCTHTGINKWSKKKPVILNQLFPDLTGNWWKAQDGNCGLSIPSYTTILELITAIRTGISWAYNVPVGGLAAPYRLADFEGYDHLAGVPFIKSNLAETYYQDLSASVAASINLSLGSDNELALTDIGNLKDYFFAAFIGTAGQNTAQWLGASTNITAGNSAVSIPISSLSPGNYDVAYFLAKVTKAALTDAEVTNTFIPLPFAIQTITIIAKSYTIIIVGTKKTTGVDWSINITNNSSSIKTFTNCVLTSRYGDKAIGSSLEAHENQISLGTITVNGNSTYTNSGTMNGAIPNYSTRGGYMLLSSTELGNVTENVYD